jgi:hypothetical protein
VRILHLYFYSVTISVIVDLIVSIVLTSRVMVSFKLWRVEKRFLQLYHKRHLLHEHLLVITHFSVCLGSLFRSHSLLIRTFAVGIFHCLVELLLSSISAYSCREFGSLCFNFLCESNVSTWCNVLLDIWQFAVLLVSLRST